jgi:hypothetical protein
VAASRVQVAGGADFSDSRPPRCHTLVGHRYSRPGDHNPLAYLFRLIAPLLVAFLVSLPLAGCTVQLAPDFDKTIVDGLTSANEQTLILFASISSGTASSPFSAREVTYNSIIGKFDALRVEATARPTPQPLILKYLGLGGHPSQAPSDSDHLTAPTPDIIANIVDKLTRMRDQDKAGPMTADVVAIYKNSYELSINQALTYEKALQR